MLGGRDDSRRFWADEYRLMPRSPATPKPYVAIMDGLVMGGGVGLSGHGATAWSPSDQIGMPEIAIGFFPDVGGTYLLARRPRASSAPTSR